MDLAKNIFAIIAGIIFFFLFAVIKVFNLIPYDKTFYYILLIVVIFALYSVGVLLIWGMEYFYKFFIAFTLTNLILVIMSPFASIGYSIYKHNKKEKEKTEQTTTKTEPKGKLVFEFDSLDCKRIRYGIFTSGEDTIIRYHSDSGDFIVRKYPKLNIKVSQQIYWKNDCEYFIKVPYLDSPIIFKIGEIIGDSSQLLRINREFDETTKEIEGLKIIEPQIKND